MDPQTYFELFRADEQRRDAEIERARTVRERTGEPGGKPRPRTAIHRRPLRTRREVRARLA